MNVWVLLPVVAFPDDLVPRDVSICLFPDALPHGLAEVEVPLGDALVLRRVFPDVVETPLGAVDVRGPDLVVPIGPKWSLRRLSSMMRTTFIKTDTSKRLLPKTF